MKLIKPKFWDTKNFISFILYPLSTITYLINIIKKLSNKRVKDEFLKILSEKNFDLSLSKMKDLELDKYIFVDIKKTPEIKIHPGFKINRFCQIKYIKSLVIDVIQDEKLDLICVLIPHLYNIEKIEIIAEAEKQSNILKGEGEAARNTILNDAFAQDPEFFEFIRSMEAYADTFKDGSTTMVISPDSDFFEYFENAEGNNQ